MRLLYFCRATYGGLADYADRQANALARAGAAVTFLTRTDYPASSGRRYDLAAALPSVSRSPGAGGRLVRRLGQAAEVCRDFKKLADHVEAGRYRHVLLGDFCEHMSPFWSRRLRRLSQEGVVFGAVVHDPVRDHAVGPRWWHRRSIARAYSFVREAFVHEKIDLDTGCPAPCLRTTVIPHGPYVFPPARHSRETVRERLRIPRGARAMLSFGHIRDGKNLDLILRAMTHFPDIWLIVAGAEQSSSQKPAEYYRELAARLGVAYRCRWLVQHVPEGEVSELFGAADLIVLTYSRQFRSASGVLNVAVSQRKPVLASSGEGNLRSMTREYGLGIWVEPDDLDALIRGLRSWGHGAASPRWEEYEEANSWRRNAETVLRHLDAPASGAGGEAPMTAAGPPARSEG